MGLTKQQIASAIGVARKKVKAGDYPTLQEALAGRGFGEDEIAACLGRAAAIDAVEKAARWRDAAREASRILHDLTGCWECVKLERRGLGPGVVDRRKDDARRVIRKGGFPGQHC